MSHYCAILLKDKFFVNTENSIRIINGVLTVKQESLLLKSHEFADGIHSLNYVSENCSSTQFECK